METAGMAHWRDLFYEVSDGLRLYARDYPGPSPDAPVALLMHGLTRNSADFEALAPVLAKTHRVLVVDQRGRGRSDRDPDASRYHLASYVGDMFELLAQQAITQVAVVGTSMGGLMAMVMNVKSPNIFSHVVINDIGPVVAPAGLARIKSYVGTGSRFSTWEEAAAHIKVLNEAAFPAYTPEAWMAFARRTCVEEGDAVVLNYDLAIAEAMKQREEAAVPQDLWPAFEALKPKRTMLVRGGISDLLDVPTAVEMRRRHPEMAFLEVPNIGHAPMLDEPGVAERIADFINDRSSRLSQL
ncbi:ABHD11 [Symbiodinium necroappetens]|uniref:ABHD11 protein n=1 Tax=Symbiodinium necroappetens TaxID=1628268 RepID=A0A812VDK5_9DINO|nr:ABHD11 [Symbiodinium necroappetens]